MHKISFILNEKTIISMVINYMKKKLDGDNVNKGHTN